VVSFDSGDILKFLYIWIQNEFVLAMAIVSFTTLISPCDLEISEPRFKDRNESWFQDECSTAL